MRIRLALALLSLVTMTVLAPQASAVTEGYESFCQSLMTSGLPETIGEAKLAVLKYEQAQVNDAALYQGAVGALNKVTTGTLVNAEDPTYACQSGYESEYVQSMARLYTTAARLEKAGLEKGASGSMVAKVRLIKDQAQARLDAQITRSADQAVSGGSSTVGTPDDQYPYIPNFLSNVDPQTIQTPQDAGAVILGNAAETFFGTRTPTTGDILGLPPDAQVKYAEYVAGLTQSVVDASGSLAANKAKAFQSVIDKCRADGYSEEFCRTLAKALGVETGAPKPTPTKPPPTATASGTPATAAATSDCVDDTKFIPLPKFSDPACQTFATIIAVLKGIVDMLLSLVLSVALLFLIITGYQFTVSQGDKTQLEAAKRSLLFIVIGVGVVLSSWLLLNTVIKFFLDV